MKSWKKPTPEQVDKAVALLVHLEHRRSFFDQLKNPEWLEPLAAKRYFKGVPDPIPQSDGAVRFPLWPQSRFLIEVAKYKPEEVLKIILENKTENQQIRSDFVDAALKMPIESAAKFSKPEAAWIKTQPLIYFLLPEKYAELAVKLAQGDRLDAAISIIESLLALGLKLEESGQEPSYFRQVIGKIGAWNYDQILKKHVPTLAEKSPERAMRMLCRILTAGIALQQRDPNDEDDGSEAWYEDIDREEEHTEYLPALVLALRETSRKWATTGEMGVKGAYGVLNSQKYKVFKRLRMWLVRNFPVPDLLEKELVAKSTFDDWSISEDYEELLIARFGDLSGDAKKQILNWIDEGPDTQKIFSNWAKQPSPEERQAWLDTWRRDW